jgi:hypothetical protein
MSILGLSAGIALVIISVVSCGEINGVKDF